MGIDTGSDSQGAVSCSVAGLPEPCSAVPKRAAHVLLATRFLACLDGLMAVRHSGPRLTSIDVLHKEFVFETRRRIS